MDEHALERVHQRIAEAAAGRHSEAKLEAALARARAEIEALTAAAGDLERTLPDRIGEAMQEGLRREVMPVGRNLAEIRGLLNNAIRRLERLEQDILAERHARIGDLEVLVDLISSGWRGVDERLQHLERPLGEIVPLRASIPAAEGGVESEDPKEPEEPEEPETPVAAAG